MNKILLSFTFLLASLFVFGQDANTGATMPLESDTATAVTPHASGVDLTYNLVIINKTASNYRITLDNHFLGKIAPKKKQTLKAQTDWAGKLVAVQLDGYDIIPSKIIWTVPKQTPGTTVTFTINKK